APSLPDYSPLTSMSSLARFPWVWVCAQAISSDLSGLSLVAVRKRPGTARRPNERELVDDPALSLLERPNAAEDGPTFVAQLVVPGPASASAFTWPPALPTGVLPVAIYRLPPDQTRIVPGPMGMAQSYEVRDSGTGEVRQIPAGDVIHIRGISWQNGTAGLYG